jgi:uncharacterized protein YqfB (UPF0267 family)
MARQINAIDTSTDTFQTWVDITNEIVDFCNTEVVSVNSTGTFVTGDGFVNGHFGSNLFSTATLRGGNTGTLAVLTIETNTFITGSRLYIGNSTVNSVMNSVSLSWSNSTLTANVGGGGATFGNSIINTVSIAVGANVVINTSSVFVGNSTVNTAVNSSSISVNDLNHSSFKIDTNSSGTNFVIDSFLSNTFRAGQYTISIKDTSTSANAYQVSQLLVTHVTDNAYVTEYGVITTNNSLGTLGVFSANANSTHVKLNFVPGVANTTVKGSKILITV